MSEHDAGRRQFLAGTGALVPNASPLAGYQFFGEVNIDAVTRALTVTLRDVADNALWSKTLEPIAAPA